MLLPTFTTASILLLLAVTSECVTALPSTSGSGNIGIIAKQNARPYKRTWQRECRVLSLFLQPLLVYCVTGKARMSVIGPK